MTEDAVTALKAMEPKRRHLATECYTSTCPFHSCHEDNEEGPYCYEHECREPACRKLLGISEDRGIIKEEWDAYILGEIDKLATQGRGPY